MKLRVHHDDTFVREELRFGVTQIQAEDPWARGPIPLARPERWQTLLAALAEATRPTIIYTMRQADCDELAVLLSHELQTTCLSYHAGLETAERRVRESAFMSGDVTLIVATSAFGMGVDKDDVRSVMHWQTPPTPEALYQEAGRAGRGPAGRPARHTLLYHERDLDDAYRLLRRGAPTPLELRRLYMTLRELADHAGNALVTTTDEDLEAMAALRVGVECRTALAHLERASLVREVDRISGVFSLELLLPDARTTSIEQVVIEQLNLGQLVEVDPSMIADRNPNVDVSDVRRAIRDLERRGVVGSDDRISVRLLDEPDLAGARLSTVRSAALALVRSVDAWADKMGASQFLSNAGEGVGDGEVVATAIEVLAGLGYVDVRSNGGSGPAPLLRRARRAHRDRLQHAFRIAPTLIGLASDVPKSLSVSTVAHNLGEPPPSIRDASVVLHLCGVASVDPRRWQGQPARRILVLDVADVETGLQFAKQALEQRARDQRLRLEVLRRYAQIEASDDDIDVHQAYLGRYLVEPDFLERVGAESASDLLTGLTPEQQDCVLAPAEPGCPLVILAGPGTGKTRSVVHRIAYRARSQEVLPDRVLAVTFTRAATEEIRVRLAQLAVRGVQVRNLHSIAVRLTMANWRQLGRPAAPQLFGGGRDRDRRQLVQSLGSNNPQADLAKIDLAKARLEPADALGAAFVAAMADRNWVDFGDCLAAAASVMRSPAGDLVRGQFDELLVDEFQDLSPAQIDLVNAFVEAGPERGKVHLTVVGDPRQAIYEWNGADPAALIAMFEDPNADTRSLIISHRSGREVLDLANGVIAKVLPQLHAVDTTASARSVVERIQTSTEAEMVHATVDRVRRWQLEGVSDHEIAVLTYKGAMVQQVATALTAAQISNHAEGLPNVNDTDAFAAARAAWAGHDRSSAPDGVSAVEVMDHLGDAGVLTQETSDEFRDDWERLRAAVDEASTQHDDLGECLAAIAKIADGPSSNTGVTVTTLHKAKGLEWDAVAVTDIGSATLGAKPESCRLLYVGATRARRHLHLSWYGTATQWLP